MSQQLITGLHHVTSLAGDAQKNIDFYTGILGLRLLKKTINFDVPSVYHMYYGDTAGNPGTIMTTFPYGSNIRRGKRGNGQMTYTRFSIPTDALEFWMKRLEAHNISFEGPKKRFDESYISFDDVDGLGLELVANDKDTRRGFTEGEISEAHAIRGFHGATLALHDDADTLAIMTQLMAYREVGREGNLIRLEVAEGGPGTYVDLETDPQRDQGIEGNGVVHHLAFATPDDETHKLIREKLVNAGVYVTPFKDRQYFHSIYFRTPGGVLFEVATIPPGFAIDEAVEELGLALKLPPWQEANRAQIEAGLQAIKYDFKLDQ